MLKKTYRLKKNKDFTITYRKGKAFFSPSIVMYVCSNNHKGIRFGFSVSKKIGKAVIRNKVKRRLREICRLNIHNLKTGYDIIIVARSVIKSKNYLEISKETQKLLKVAKVKISE